MDRRTFIAAAVTLPVAALPVTAQEPTPQPAPETQQSMMTLKFGTITLTAHNTFTTHGVKWSLGLDNYHLSPSMLTFSFLCPEPDPDKWFKEFQDHFVKGTLFYFIGEENTAPNTTSFYLRGYKCVCAEFHPNRRMTLSFAKDYTPNRS